VRVFIAGSVFGGTGAAGFPTIARLLRQIIDEQGRGDLVSLTGALMLPYFSFPPPPMDATGKEANVARSEDLIVNTQEALKYYHRLFDAERVFDDMFMFGWDPPFHIDFHQPGSKAQRNQSLPPELYPAICAARCLHLPFEPPGERPRMFTTSREKASALSWRDLPAVSRDEPGSQGEVEGRNKIYRTLAQGLRFALAWRYQYRDAVRANVGRMFGKDDWYKACGLESLKSADVADGALISQLDQYTDYLLTWAAEMRAASPQHVDRFLLDLWQTDDLAFKTPNADTPVRLRDPEDFGKAASTGREENVRALFDQLIIPPDGASGERPKNFATVYQLMQKGPTDAGKASRGVGRFVHALFEHAAVR
jgi:hypothetical protein